jgi:hypothetical protein
LGPTVGPIRIWAEAFAETSPNSKKNINLQFTQLKKWLSDPQSYKINCICNKLPENADSLKKKTPYIRWFSIS